MQGVTDLQFCFNHYAFTSQNILTRFRPLDFIIYRTYNDYGDFGIIYKSDKNDCKCILKATNLEVTTHFLL